MPARQYLSEGTDAASSFHLYHFLIARKCNRTKCLMKPRDHNKTLAILNAGLGIYVLLPLLAAPWVLAKNIDAYPSPRRADQVLLATVICSVLILLGSLFLLTAYRLWRKKRWSRRVALIAAAVQFCFLTMLGGYRWWFLHSDGGRRLYVLEIPPD